jgi:hypothetical protein
MRIRIHNTEKCDKKVESRSQIPIALCLSTRFRSLQILYVQKYLVIKEGAACEQNVVEGQVVAVAGERWAQRTRLVHI